MTKSKRTDPHRPGAIIPEDYSYVLAFELPGADAFHWNVDALAALMREKDEQFFTRSRCNCSVCGAHFRSGEVWFHNPTSQYIFLGCDCAQKYDMIREYEPAWDAARAAHDRATAARRIAEQNREEREAFLNEHPGLAEAFEVDHPIIRDIAARFKQYRSISDKQVAFVFKLADEVRNPPPPREAEKTVTAPTGRREITGTVVSQKVYEGDWGPSTKIVVKVETPDGVWLAFGTAPRALMDRLSALRWDLTSPEANAATLRGRKVTFTATLKPGRDAHFALFSRPTGGEFIAP